MDKHLSYQKIQYRRNPRQRPWKIIVKSTPLSITNTLMHMKKKISIFRAHTKFARLAVGHTFSTLLNTMYSLLQ